MGNQLTKKIILHIFNLYKMKDNKLASGYRFRELTAGQRQTFQGALEVYRAHLETLGQSRVLKGGMHWKKIRGREYLYRYRDRFGHGESLGPRSEQTQRLYDDFTRERQELTERRREQRRRLEEQARYCRAARINRLPRMAAKILRRLEQHEQGRNCFIIGATALYAYEFAAGVFLESLGPWDLLSEAGRRLTLAGGDMSLDELVQLLRRADRSFAPLPGEECRAVNRDGFLVRLFKTEGGQPGRQKPVTVPGAREPLPPGAGHLQHLLALPKFLQVVIGQDGTPATLMAPDPWAFALNRLWLSQQADRDEGQRARDLGQALAVAELVLRYLPQYDFSSSELDMFPRELRLDGEGTGEEPTEDEIIEY
jgi:hypothetical protein